LQTTARVLVADSPDPTPSAWGLVKPPAEWPREEDV
jgi:hypothetical protein